MSAAAPRPEQLDQYSSSRRSPGSLCAVATLLLCLPPLTWIATGLLAGWLAAHRGKSWYRGFALGFFFSIAGVALASLPPMSLSTQRRQGDQPGPGQGDA